MVQLSASLPFVMVQLSASLPFVMVQLSASLPFVRIQLSGGMVQLSGGRVQLSASLPFFRVQLSAGLNECTLTFVTNNVHGYVLIECTRTFVTNSVGGTVSVSAHWVYTDIGDKHCGRYCFCICPLSVHGHWWQTAWAVLFLYLPIECTRTFATNSVGGTVSVSADWVYTDISYKWCGRYCFILCWWIEHGQLLW